ncbi:hypothetical protein D1006_16590 [Burkholderia stabilis]|uniref:Uncharacterized protein n=1 Tax=Burkholderia stabilis TaxID=95485 RepID=A0A4Q2AV67_9BURK|nr:hypothetical protein D1006_16590 [Burkholderia stabilis]
MHRPERPALRDRSCRNLAHTCAASLSFPPHPVCGQIAFRRPCMRSIPDRELTLRLIHVLELMRVAKCRGKTFVFMSQSFAR